eukprot:scaffold2458_cov121-Isochrysis_galbana.AAC.2
MAESGHGGEASCVGPPRRSAATAMVWAPPLHRRHNCNLRSAPSQVREIAVVRGSGRGRRVRQLTGGRVMERRRNNDCSSSQRRAR